MFYASFEVYGRIKMIVGPFYQDFKLHSVTTQFIHYSNAQLRDLLTARHVESSSVIVALLTFLKLNNIVFW